MNIRSSLQSDFTRRTEDYIKLHQGLPTRPYITNLETSVELLQHDTMALPCTVNNAEHGNAWVCAPSTAYGSYLIEEINRYLPSPAAFPVASIFRGYSYFLKRSYIDRAVAVNNWMLSTNLFPDFNKSALL